VIDRPEILEFAREVGLTPEILEKDYVLGLSVDEFLELLGR
jgi:hypothetical protein